MKTHDSVILIAAGLLMAGLSAVVNATQYDTGDACCLAAEWFAPATGASAQSSDAFCCIASEWSADHEPTLQQRAESGAQSSGEDSCCIANEWDAS